VFKRNIALDIAKGMFFMHSQVHALGGSAAIIHNDLKSLNIMVSSVPCSGRAP
jgi:serine/threonine protein kinase